MNRPMETTRVLTILIIKLLVFVNRDYPDCALAAAFAPNPGLDSTHCW